MSHPEDQLTLYLLTGLPCSGKTTHARALAESGIVRVSVDELMIAANGRLNVDYQASEHLALLAPIVNSAVAIVENHLSRNESVVLDHGLGQRAERTRWKQLAETNGATWNLLCFETEIAVLRDRCRLRADQPDMVPISDDVLDFLDASWERPNGEGEQIVRS